MTDDAPEPDDAQSSSPDAQGAHQTPPAVTGTPAGQWPSRPMIGAFAMLALAGVTGINIFLIFPTSPAEGAMASIDLKAQPLSDALGHVVPATTGPAPPLEEAELPTAEPVPDDTGPVDEPTPREPKEKKRIGTVDQASARSCSTSSVDGLSRQIIAQARCIDANAFVRVPARPNLVTSSHVFLYMEASARDRLVSVLDAHRDRTMTVNSALRTVAQQYLVWRWSASKRCGVQLATPPGESNHETGLALDIAEAGTWRSVLEANDFHWLGAIDKVHFDYKGSRAVPRNIDVMAFQQLWNRAHPDDTIDESGHYSAATEQRLKKSPAGGFAVEPRCGKARGVGGGGSSHSLVR